jgi:hypothetical protein
MNPSKRKISEIVPQFEKFIPDSSNPKKIPKYRCC